MLPAAFKARRFNSCVSDPFAPERSAYRLTALFFLIGLSFLQDGTPFPAKRLFSTGRLCAILIRKQRGSSAGHRRSLP